MSAETVIDTVATSLGAIGAGGALIIAAAAYKQQTRDRHREQASKVHGWTDASYESGASLRNVRVVAVRIRNASDQPIFQVIAQVTDRRQELGELQRLEYDTLPPLADEFAYLNDDARIAFEAEPPLRVLLQFTDSAGARWSRDGETGRLREVRD